MTLERRLPLCEECGHTKIAHRKNGACLVPLCGCQGYEQEVEESKGV